jgi:virulence factor Mce-like protein
VQKQAPTLGRLLVMVGFALSCFGLLLFLWLAFGGPVPLKPKGYRFHASFGEATQLAKEADVRISGVSVGKVKTIQTDKHTGRSDATIELKVGYAPLPKDSKAILRQKTLLGETYVELSPGNKANGYIKEDGTLSAAHVSPTVELDEIFRAFDAKTRESFRQWMQQQAAGIKGRGQDLNDALGNLAPFAEDTSRLLTILNSQEGAVRRLVSNTGVVFNALSERQGQLGSLITNSNRVFETTASRDQQLEQAFKALPTFEKESQATPRGPAAQPDAAAAQRAGARRQEAVPRHRPARHRVQDRPARHPALPRRAAPAAGELRPGPAPGQPDPGLPRPVQGRAQLVLRQHSRRDPGLHDPEARRTAALPAHDEPDEPRELRGLSAPHRHQPAQPVRVPAGLPEPAPGHGVLRDAPLRPRHADDRQPGAGPAAPGPSGQPPEVRLRRELRDPGPAVQAAGQVHGPG